jgi:hypothetical protein
MSTLEPLIGEDDDPSILYHGADYYYPWQRALCELLKTPRHLSTPFDVLSMCGHDLWRGKN